jgi:uncharacterized membrane-anchored protein
MNNTDKSLAAPPRTGKFFAVVSDSRGWLKLEEKTDHSAYAWGHPLGNLRLFGEHTPAFETSKFCGGDARVVVVVLHD